jgi:hypothetical protein
MPSRRLALVLTAGLAFAAAACRTTPPPPRVDQHPAELKHLRAYLTARDRGDAGAARSYLAADARFWIGSKQGPGRPLGGRRDFADWEAAVGARFAYSDFRAEAPGSIHYLSSESSELSRLLGAEALRGEVTCWFDGMGRISGMLFRPLGPRMEDLVRPYVEWARRHHPERLAELLPQGEMVYDGETARKWIEALREWRSATRGRSLSPSHP